MYRLNIKPTLFLGGFFLASLQACSFVPLQSDVLLDTTPSEFRQKHELTKVNFNAQKDYECGPASLATLLQWQGIKISDSQLVPEVYIPQKKGSLQVELISTTRRHGLIPYIIEPNMSGLLREVKAGHPVLVLQNLRVSWYPQWHYAVVIGYDLLNDEIILRSGETKRHKLSFSEFESTWRKAKYWGFIALTNKKLPASKNAFAYLKSVVPFEELKKVDFALKAYKNGLQRWPDNKNLLTAAGNTSYAMGYHENADKYYRKVIFKWPKFAPALNNIAQILYEQKKYRAAEKFILRAIAVNDRHQKSYKKTLKEIRNVQIKKQ